MWGLFSLISAVVVFFFTVSISVLDIREGGDVLGNDPISPPMAAWEDEQRLPLVPPPPLKKPEGYLWLSTEEIDTTPLQEEHAQDLNSASLGSGFSNGQNVPVSPSFSQAWVAYMSEHRALAALKEPPAQTAVTPDLAQSGFPAELESNGGVSELRQKWVGNIWVGLPSEWPTAPASKGETLQKQASMSQTSPELKGEVALQASSVSAAPVSAALVPATLVSSLERQISGVITLPPGAAYLGGLRVYREWGGFVFEKGKIHPEDGTYEITLESPSNTGVLVAELRDKEGQLLGKKRSFFG